MSLVKPYSLDAMNNHLVSLVVFLGALQFGLMNSGVNFNVFFAEWAIIIWLLAVNRFRVFNYANIVTLLLCSLVFILSLLFNSNPSLNFYIKEYFIYAAPLLLAFTIKLDLLKFSKTFSKCG